MLCPAPDIHYFCYHNTVMILCLSKIQLLQKDWGSGGGFVCAEFQFFVTHTHSDIVNLVVTVK